MAFIQLDRPRRLRFGFSAFDYLKTVFGATDIQTYFNELKKGDLSVVANFIEACMSGDMDGLDVKQFKNLLDDYIEKNSLEKLTSLMTEVVEESALFKEVKKKQALAEKQKK